MTTLVSGRSFAGGTNQKRTSFGKDEPPMPDEEALQPASAPKSARLHPHRYSDYTMGTMVHNHKNTLLLVTGAILLVCLLLYLASMVSCRGQQ